MAAVHSEGSDGTDGAPCGRVAHVTGDRPLDPALKLPPLNIARDVKREGRIGFPQVRGSRDPALKDFFARLDSGGILARPDSRGTLDT